MWLTASPTVVCFSDLLVFVWCPAFTYPKMQYKGAGPPRKHHIQKRGVVSKPLVELVDDEDDTVPLAGAARAAPATRSSSSGPGADFKLDFDKLPPTPADPQQAATRKPRVAPTVAELLAQREARQPPPPAAAPEPARRATTATGAGSSTTASPAPVPLPVLPPKPSAPLTPQAAALSSTLRQQPVAASVQNPQSGAPDVPLPSHWPLPNGQGTVSWMVFPCGGAALQPWVGQSQPLPAFLQINIALPHQVRRFCMFLCFPPFDGNALTIWIGVGIGLSSGAWFRLDRGRGSR